MLDPNSKIEQCIHTGCGKDCSGRFDTWAQSSGLEKLFYSHLGQSSFDAKVYLQRGKSLDETRLKYMEEPVITFSKRLREGAQPSGLFKKTYKDRDYETVEVQGRSGVSILDENVKGNLKYDDYADFDFRENPEQAPFRVIAYTDGSNHLVVIRRTWIGAFYGTSEGRDGNFVDHVMYFPEGTKIEDIDVKKLPFVKGLPKKYFRTEHRPNDPFEPAPKYLEPIDAGKMMAGGYTNTNAAKQQTSAPQTNIPKQPQQAPQQPQQNAPKTQPTTTQQTTQRQTAQSQPQLSLEERTKQIYDQATKNMNQQYMKYSSGIRSSKLAELMKEQLLSDEVSKMMEKITDTDLYDSIYAKRDSKLGDLIYSMSVEECGKTLSDLSIAMNNVRKTIKEQNPSFSEDDVFEELKNSGWANAEFLLNDYVGFRKNELLEEAASNQQTTTQQQQPAPQPAPAPKKPVQILNVYEDFFTSDMRQYQNTFNAARSLVDLDGKLTEVGNRIYLTKEARQKAMQPILDQYNKAKQDLSNTFVGLSSEDIRNIELISRERQHAVLENEKNYAAEQEIEYSAYKTQNTPIYKVFSATAEACRRETRTRSSNGPTM